MEKSPSHVEVLQPAQPSLENCPPDSHGAQGWWLSWPAGGHSAEE